MQLNRLLKDITIQKIKGKRDLVIRGISVDSRRVKRDYLFLALRGNFQDGHKFIPQAIKKGAIAVLTEQDIDFPINGLTFIKVSDTREIISILANNFYQNPSRQMELVGITGTNGKTTISYLVEHILKSSGLNGCVGRIGTIDYSWKDRRLPSTLTTPEPIYLYSLLQEMRRDGVEYSVMEVSSHSLAQKRVDGLEFSSIIFTNITRDHLDYHSSFTHYVDAKKRLIDLLKLSPKKDKFVVLNGDDKQIKDFPLSGLPGIYYGLEPSNDVRAYDLDCSWKGLSFKLKSPWYAGGVEVPLVGGFNVYNILAAISWAGMRSMEVNKVIKDLRKFPKVPGRFQVLKKNGYRVVVDYAHTPDALENLIKNVRELTPGRIITLFGCGGDRDKGKRPLMGRISSQLGDYTVLTSDNPRSEDPKKIIEDISKGVEGNDWGVEEDRLRAIRKGLEMAVKGDTLLIAGKGHENYQILKDVVRPFSDVEVVKKIWSNRKSSLPETRSEEDVNCLYYPWLRA